MNNENMKYLEKWISKINPDNPDSDSELAKLAGCYYKSGRSIEIRIKKKLS